MLKPVPKTSETNPVAASSDPLIFNKYQMKIMAKTIAMPNTIDKTNEVLTAESGSIYEMRKRTFLTGTLAGLAGGCFSDIS